MILAVESGNEKAGGPIQLHLRRRFGLRNWRHSATVDVWLIEVADHGELGLCAATSLLGDEAGAWQKLQPADARRSIVARAALVRLVAERTGMAPERVVIGHDRSGRPLLRGGSGLEVSIAHSAGLGACALSARRVGVDVERLDRSEADDALAGRVCTPAELRHLQTIHSQGRRAELVRLWARKEALAKALGVGLALPFERTDVSGARPLLDGVASRTWWIRDLEEAPHGYAAAVAGEGRRVPVTRVRLLPAPAADT